ncbi:hypothetical protein [Rhodalgimonas zhirmunskyi]|uniref:Uncharacterized protein n=1 Tax=Rhodalgimonas zhirmunskyi TaxID=2964767 RepID=A0AAJ1U8E3_9RHOB|nr:hypothetical protein [Rhodoalgimonas zhirmunskyi]MDQ2093675.1 hypothetical protein [Rhodoalgimonas zhirmunskyi]
MRKMIGRISMGLALAAVLAVGGRAEELAPRYEQIGRVTVTLDGAPMELVVTRDTETGRAGAEQKKVMGSFLTVNVLGQTIGDEGAPGNPMVQATFQKQMGPMTLLSAEIFDSGFDTPMVMSPDGGEVGKVTLSFEGDHLSARIEGRMQRLEGYAKGQPKAKDGAAPVPVVIEIEADVPAMK